MGESSISVTPVRSRMRSIIISSKCCIRTQNHFLYDLKSGQLQFWHLNKYTLTDQGRNSLNRLNRLNLLKMAKMIKKHWNSEGFWEFQLFEPVVGHLTGWVFSRITRLSPWPLFSRLVRQQFSCYVELEIGRWRAPKSAVERNREEILTVRGGENGIFVVLKQKNRRSVHVWILLQFLKYFWKHTLFYCYCTLTTEALREWKRTDACHWVQIENCMFFFLKKLFSFILFVLAYFRESLMPDVQIKDLK